VPKPRIKDFYDICLLSQSFPFDDGRLARAIAATFERRGTEIPAELPDALTSAFAEDEHKQRQWNVFLENVALHSGSLADVIVDSSCLTQSPPRRSAGTADVV